MENTKNNFKDKKYLIQLIKSVLLDEKCPEKPEEVSFEEVFKIANFHSMSDMAYYGILKLKNKPEKNLLNRWKKSYMLGILKDNTQAQELKKILIEFEKEEIDNVVLKGFELKALYPKHDMREMGDIDILISSLNKNKAGEIMEKLGYFKERYETEREIVYKKKPLMNVEIHTGLFNEESIYYNYFLKLSNMEKLEHLEGHRYKFSSEDSFIYNFAHLALHFSYKGTGIRSIVDQWLYKRKALNLDWEYIEKQLKELKLDIFYKNILELAEYWFEDRESNYKIEKLERYIFDSGLYGNLENYGVVRLSRNGKMKAIFSLLFPTFDFMVERFPSLKKKPYLLVVFYVVRWLILFKNYGLTNIKKVFGSILFTKKSKVEDKKKFFEDIGL